MTERLNKVIDTIKKIGSSKGFLITFSLVCGIVAWLFVLDSKNPVTERTVAVELEFVNFQDPAEKNLTLVSELGVVSANVKISGREDVINNVISSDFKLKVDFSKVKEKGTSYIPVDFPECDKLGVKIEDYYPKEITVSYDSKAEIYLPVKVDFDEAMLKAGYEIISVVAEPDNVPIRDFESAIENLEYISVDVSENGAGGSVDGDKTLRFIGRFRTKNGGDVTANFDTQNITVQIDVAKRVPVVYTIEGEPAEDHYFIEDKVSENWVLVDGNNKELADIESLELGPVDINGATGDIVKTFELSEHLSGSLYAIDPQTVTVTARISALELKTFTLPVDSISYSGKNDSLYDYSIDFSGSDLDKNGNLLVKIKGRKEDLEKISLSSLRPTLDLSDKVGLYNMLPVEFELPEGVTLEGEYLADVEVAFKPTPTPTLPPTQVPTKAPTPVPTVKPTVEPTFVPTAEPTVEPTLEPTVIPDIGPSPTDDVVETPTVSGDVGTEEPTSELTPSPVPQDTLSAYDYHK